MTQMTQMNAEITHVRLDAEDRRLLRGRPVIPGGRVKKPQMPQM